MAGRRAGFPFPRFPASSSPSRLAVLIMDTPKFTTYWIIDGQQYFNIDEVYELVAGGAVAAEVSATKQAEDFQRQQILERWHQQSLDRHAKIVAEQNHLQTPEGKREAVLLHAAMNPGGIVSGARNPVFDELNQYSPANTDVFK